MSVKKLLKFTQEDNTEEIERLEERKKKIDKIVHT